MREGDPRKTSKSERIARKGRTKGKMKQTATCIELLAVDDVAVGANVEIGSVSRRWASHERKFRSHNEEEKHGIRKRMALKKGA